MVYHEDSLSLKSNTKNAIMNSLQLQIWYVNQKKNSFTILIPLNCSFDDLMLVILDQMKWDSDHLFAIYCSYAGTTKRTMVKNSFVFTTDPMDENERCSSNKLQSIDWSMINGIFVNYDFGDNHWFECKILKLKEEIINNIIIVDEIKETWDQYQ